MVVRSLPLLALAALLLAPRAARSLEEPASEPELVVEANFLHDCLPPGGRDLALSLAIQRGEPDPATGERSVEASPRVQLAMALGERLGFTAEVGLDPSGETLDAPAAALKVLLREPGAGRTGASLSLDLLGSTHSLAEEAGVGVGAIRSLGGVAIRGAVTVATGLSSWSPHVHAGLSAALALGARWRALGELVAEAGAGELAVSAGPTLKVALGEGTSLMAGALFRVAPARPEGVIALQLAQAI